jgi:putative transcriptional regulator
MRKEKMSKAKKALRARDARRNIGMELLQSVREMKGGRRGRTHKVKVPPYEGQPHE